MSLRPGTLRVSAWPLRDGRHGRDGRRNCKRRDCAVCETPPTVPMRTRTLADEVRAAQVRKSDDAVIRRWAQEQIRAGWYPESARDILAGMRWRKPVTPIWDMTDAQRWAALGAELKRLRGRGDDGDE